MRSRNVHSYAWSSDSGPMKCFYRHQARKLNAARFPLKSILCKGGPRSRPSEVLRDNPFLRLLRPDDNPYHTQPPPHLPQNTHPGHDGSHKLLSRSPKLAYVTTTATPALTSVLSTTQIQLIGKARSGCNCMPARESSCRPLRHLSGARKRLRMTPSSG